MNMYIGNLNYRVKEEELGQFLSTYGIINSVKIIKDRETGKSKGYGFVDIDDRFATKILQELNGAEFVGRELVLKRAIVKDR